MAAEDLEWERSKISNQDVNLMKRLGLMKKEDAIRFPSEESYPKPPMEYRARKNPLWTYSGANDANRLSSDLSVKDLEKLIRRITSLSKKDPIPSSCRVEPYSSTNPLPENHPTMSSLPPLPEDGEVEEMGIITDDNQEVPSFVNDPVDSRKSAGSSEDTTSVQSPPPAVSPQRKRKRNDVEDSGTSKAEEVVPSHPKATYDPYVASLVSSDDEEEPMIKDLIRIGSQFIGYREYASRAEEKLAEANKRADSLAHKLEHSEAAREKAELAASEARAEADNAKAKAASVEELQKRLKDAESALDEQKAAQAAREQGVIKRLKSQSRRTLTQTNQDFDLENPVDDPLLDALSLLEFHGREIREGVANASAGLSALFPYFFPKKEEPSTFLALAKLFNSSEDLGLKIRHENMKVAVENTVALVADSQQTLDWMKIGDTDQIEQSRWKSLIKAAKPNTKKILAYLGIKPASTPSSSRPEV
ncbi:hypothetical protein QYE76_069537 [Lolium multiflorum]|uniref:FRIGIDA-like protein n=1 Tax=Lolium multiflorum TaxID=4521 RepID=A0AAD8SIF0_LOLMU|nr:hypothetical protein QYE76_069537 [Lolium multiflorum]